MRTVSMPHTLIATDGMVHHDAPLTVERILDLAIVDADGHILVRMIDILALVRLDADAEIVLVRHRDGSSCALSVRELTNRSDLFVLLDVRVASTTGTEVVPRLWSSTGGASSPIASLSAISFSTFVGRS